VICDAELNQPKISLYEIPAGYPGTLKTAGHIARLIKLGAKDFEVRQTAIDILVQRGVKPKDYIGEIKAVFEWVQQKIRYTKDTVRVEVLHSARRMLELRAGDCDDFSILLGAMLEAIGHPVRLILTGPDPLRQDLYSHIFVEAFCKSRWIPLDATMPYPMGWAPRTAVKKIISIERRPDMLDEDLELNGIGVAATVPDWLKGLIRSVRSEAMHPKDLRVKSLWNLLKERQLLSRNPWLKAVLRRIWDQGLPARPRPVTTSRMVESMRHLGILPAHRAGEAAHRPLTSTHALRPVALRPVGRARPAAMQPARGRP
jgi:Transglutaminase-like superfamily